MSKIIKSRHQEQEHREIRTAPECVVESKHDARFFSYDDLWLAEDKAAVQVQIDPLEELKREQEKIKRQSEAILSRARQESEKIAQDAYKEGFAKGQEAGLAAGRQQYREKIAALEHLFESIQQQHGTLFREYEPQLLPLIKVMVDRLVNHEVSVNPNVIKTCLNKALACAVDNSRVIVHLHGHDFNRIKEASLEDENLLSGKNKIQLVEDPNIAEGGCFLETDNGEVDATLEYAREKLFQAVERSFIAALAAHDGEEGS